MKQELHKGADTQTDLSKWYDMLYEKQGTWISPPAIYFQAAGLTIKHLPSDLENINFMDVGCGGGWFYQVLSVMYSHIPAEFYGIELSKEARRVANEISCKDIPGFMGVSDLDAHDMKKDFAENSFDVVFCLGSLEHMFDPIEAVQGMLRAAKRFVIILVPMYSPATVMAERGDGFTLTEFQPNELFCDDEGWRDIFSKAGGKVIDSLDAFSYTAVDHKWYVIESA